MNRRHFLLLTINFLMIVGISNCRGKIKGITTENKIIEKNHKDTLELLAGNHIKFWDVLNENEPPIGQDEGIRNWMFSTNKRLIEYSYSNKKRYLNVYGDDVMLGELKIDFINDTLFIPELSDTKYLIKRLNEDTLIVQKILGVELKAPIIYVKSTNQTEIPKM